MTGQPQLPVAYPISLPDPLRPSEIVLAAGEMVTVNQILQSVAPLVSLTPENIQTRVAEIGLETSDNTRIVGLFAEVSVGLKAILAGSGSITVFVGYDKITEQKVLAVQYGVSVGVGASGLGLVDIEGGAFIFTGGISELAGMSVGFGTNIVVAGGVSISLGSGDLLTTLGASISVGVDGELGLSRGYILLDRSRTNSGFVDPQPLPVPVPVPGAEPLPDPGPGQEGAPPFGTIDIPRSNHGILNPFHQFLGGPGNIYTATETVAGAEVFTQLLSEVPTDRLHTIVTGYANGYLTLSYSTIDGANNVEVVNRIAELSTQRPVSEIPTITFEAPDPTVPDFDGVGLIAIAKVGDIEVARQEYGPPNPDGTHTLKESSVRNENGFIQVTEFYLNDAGQLVPVATSVVVDRGGDTIEEALGEGEGVPPENLPGYDINAVSPLYGELGAIFGSAIGSAIADDYDFGTAGNLAVDVVASTVFGQIGASFGAALGASLEQNKNFFDEFGSNLYHAFSTDVLKVTLGQSAVGSVSSLLVSELGLSYGVDGFIGEYLDFSLNSTLTAVVHEGIVAVVTNGFDTFAAKLAERLGNVNPVASFLGSKLGSQVVSPTTEAGAVLGSVGSYAGAFVAGKLIGNQIGAVLNLAIPVVGSFIGFVLGTLIGNLFGRKKPKIPQADASTELSFVDGYYYLGDVNSVNNGNEDFVTGMANAAADSLNAAINLISGAGLNARNINTTSPTQKYGHGGPNQNQAGDIYVTVGGVKHLVDTADEAVDIGTMAAIKKTKIAGGQLFFKRAVLATQAESLTSLGSEFQIAEDLGTYYLNQETIDSAISAPYDSLSGADKSFYADNEANFLALQRQDQVQLTQAQANWYTANQVRADSILETINSISPFAAGWIITLQRAAELGLNKSAASDFYGGAKGFVDSLQGIINAPLDYENVLFDLDGQDLKIIRDSNANGVIDAGEDVVFNERGFLNAAGHAGGGVGYHQADSNDTMTFGNDIIIGASGTVDDLTYQAYEVWIPSPASNVPGFYHPVTSLKAGGDDIIIGDSGANTLYGRDGDDWLDGGAGADNLYGGTGHDVLIGRDDADNLYGQDGDDVLIGGTGLDRVYGGAGNDTIIRSAESGYSFGGGGDDLLIATQGTGYAGHFRGGVGTENAGNDTISFERYSEGITLDMRYRSASWEGHASAFYSNPNVRHYMVYSNDASNSLISFMFVSQIDNVTGTSFADILHGDDQHNILRGGDGDDDLYGYGGLDTLEGGAGADTLRSSHGAPGIWGRTTISYENSSAGVDVAIIYTTAGSAASDVLGVQHAFGGDASGDVFIGFMNHLTGSAYSDVLQGNHFNNEINGLDGDDYFIATRGNDIYRGGEGFDTLDFGNHLGTTGLSINAYDGGQTSGYVNGFHGAAGVTKTYDIEHVVGTQHADEIITGDGDNVLEGGKGNDRLYGGAGNDIYFVEIGGGSDTIYEPNTRDLSGGDGFAGIVRLIAIASTESAGHDTIMVGYDDGLSWDDVVIGGGQNLTVTVNGELLATALNSPNQSRELVGVDAIDIGGTGGVDVWYLTGGSWSGGGDSGNNVLRGHGDGRGFSLLQGFDGNDTIYASGNSYGYASTSQQDNFFHGGRGNDTIYASGGDDQYIFDRGSGRDTVTDTGGLDHIQFGPGVAANDLVFTVVGNDLYIGIRPQDDDGSVELSAQNMDDYIRIRNGGIATGSAGSLNHNAHLLEYLTVENTNIDVRTLDINWTIDNSGSGPGQGPGSINTGGNTGGTYNLPPLMFDLDGDGLELVSINSSRVVVRGEDDSLTRVGWLGGDDGFLALDRDGNGKIDNLNEISFAQDLEGAVTDLEGLRAYDSNDDGMFNASDARFGEFLIWQDKNQNGRGGRAELMSLEEAGIAEINLTGQSTGKDPNNHADSVIVNTTAYTRTDGTTATAYDVMLAASVIVDGRETDVNMSVADVIMSGRLGRISTRRLERLIVQSEAIEANMLSTVVAPIVLDMDGDGELALTDLTQSGVSIDVDYNGYADRIGWVGAQDGLLGLDRNGDGLITAVSEISFLEDVEGAITDLEGLAAFDSNANGLLDAGDGRWGDFRIWQDVNQDGVSQIQELVTLDTAGLVSVNLTAHTGQENYGGDVENSIFGLTAINWADGRETVAGDVGLRVEYAGLTTADGAQQAVYLTGYAGMEHISAQAMIDFTQLATNSAWGRLAGRRSPLLAKYYAAEAEAARLDALGLDTGYTQDELLAQFENDADDNEGETTEQADARIAPDDLSGEADLLLSGSTLYEADFGLGGVSFAGGLQDLMVSRSVGMQSKILAANDVDPIRQAAGQTLQVDILRQAVAGFGETGFGAMTGSSVLPDEDNAMLSVKKSPALHSAGISHI